MDNLRNYRLEYLDRFLCSRGWRSAETKGIYQFYAPPKELELPQEYRLEVPKDEQVKGFNYYIDSVVDVIVDLYDHQVLREDLEVMLTTDNSILSFQIIDYDTKTGTIEFPRLVKSYSACLRVLRDTVSFVSTGLQIFAQAKDETEQFLSLCRGLQTQKGSYVTRIELPNYHMSFLFQEIDTKEIINKTIGAIDFFDKEVLTTNLNKIDREYVLSNSLFLNIELLTSIKNLLKMANIRKANIRLLNNDIDRNIKFDRINNAKIIHSEQYIKLAKEILLKEEPTEVIGKVVRLYSQAPQSSNKNKIELEAYLGFEKTKVEVVLDSENYQLAINAHGEELTVKVVGMAIQKKDSLYIPQPQSFSVSPL